jgi:hypothetical protein
MIGIQIKQDSLHWLWEHLAKHTPIDEDATQARFDILSSIQIASRNSSYLEDLDLIELRPTVYPTPKPDS